MKSLLLTTSIVPIALTPIAVISCSSETETAVSRSATLQKNRAEAAPAGSTTAPSEYTAAPEYTGAQDIITDANQSNLRDFEEAMIEADPNVWQSKYVVPKYDDMLIRQWYANAAKDGWQSIDDYMEYQHYVYERGIKKTKNANTFGAQPSGNEASWLAFHYGPGGTLSEPGAFQWGATADWTANVSGCAPMWKGAEKETFNHIDNNLKWYHYEGADMNQFLFDENNKENAVNRLIFMNRLQRVSPSGLMNEEGMDVAPAEGIKRDEHKITRGKYVMLDGVLTDVNNLPFGNYKMYYVSDNGASDDGDGWIRDDHGWKVVVTDRNLDKMFTQVINPTSQDTVDTHPEVATTSVAVSSISLFEGNVSHVDAPSVVNYPSDYNVNKEFDIEHRFSAASADKLDKTDIKLSTGKYTITQAENSFSELATNPNIHLPYRDTRGQSLEYRGNASAMREWPDRFGRKGKYYGSYGENGVHLSAWAWVEDGHGGHKIWKSAERLRHLLDVWADPTDQRSVAQINNLQNRTGLTREQLVPCKGHGDYRFFGNFQRIYPVGSWYKNSEFFELERGV